MRDLTAREAEVFEAVRAGIRTIKGLAAHLHRSEASIVSSLRRLRDIGIVQEAQRSYCYEPKVFTLVPPDSTPAPRERRRPTLSDPPGRRRPVGPLTPAPYYRGLRW